MPVGNSATFVAFDLGRGLLGGLPAALNQLLKELLCCHQLALLGSQRICFALTNTGQRVAFTNKVCRHISLQSVTFQNHSMIQSPGPLAFELSVLQSLPYKAHFSPSERQLVLQFKDLLCELWHNLSILRSARSFARPVQLPAHARSSSPLTAAFSCLNPLVVHHQRLHLIGSQRGVTRCQSLMFGVSAS